MTAIEKELESIKEDIANDVKELVEKYISVTSWDVPENDENIAKEKILQVAKEAILQLEKTL